MADNIEINALDGTPAPAPAPAAQGGASLPEELLQLPVMQALMAGQPGAVSDNVEQAQNTEFGLAVSKFGKEMQKAGFGFYLANDGQLGVIFNQLYVNPEDILAADNAGTIQELAPPVAQVEQGILSDPGANPVLGDVAPPGAAAPVRATGGSSGGAAAVPAASGPGNAALAAKRRQNVQTKGPTDSARPAAGKILNDILKPVV